MASLDHDLVAPDSIDDVSIALVGALPAFVASNSSGQWEWVVNPATVAAAPSSHGIVYCSNADSPGVVTIANTSTITDAEFLALAQAKGAIAGNQIRYDTGDGAILDAVVQDAGGGAIALDIDRPERVEYAVDVMPSADNFLEGTEVFQLKTDESLWRLKVDDPPKEWINLGRMGGSGGGSSSSTFDPSTVYLMKDAGSESLGSITTQWVGARAYLEDGTKLEWNGSAWVASGKSFATPKFKGDLNEAEVLAFRQANNLFGIPYELLPEPVTSDAEKALATQAAILATRIGPAEAVTGGQGGVLTPISDLSDGSLLTALTDATARIIYYDKDALSPGAVYTVPQGEHVFGPNKTVINNLNILWQFGIPNSVAVDDDRTGLTYRFRARNGNLILYGVRGKGDLAVGSSLGPSANGDTEFMEIHDGENYLVKHCEFESFSDETYSIYHFPIEAHPNKVTYEHNKVHNDRAVAICGSQWATGSNIALIGQYYNWYKDTQDGRCPGLCYFSHAEFGANVVENYSTDAIVARQGAEVRSWRNIIRPGPHSNTGVIIAQPRTPDTAAGGTAGPAGKIDSQNDYVTFDPGYSSIYNTHHNVPDGTIFTNSWASHGNRAGTSESAVETYVKANAGVAPVLAAWAAL